MAKNRCFKCRRIIIDAADEKGNVLELATYEGPRIYGVKAVRAIPDLSDSQWVNKAFVVSGWVEHECTKMPETLGDAARTPMQEFPSLGDPGTVEP